jgi:L-cysteine desulfidase
MRFSDFLAAEWKPALGCTEPAAIAYAAALSSQQVEGPVKRVHLQCDARTYKNGYAVGIPNSGHRTGILWALAIGSHLKDPSLGLRCFEQVTAEVLTQAEALFQRGQIHVDVVPDKTTLHIECTVEKEGGYGRALLEREHTRLCLLEANGHILGGEATTPETPEIPSLRSKLARLDFRELVELARSLTEEDRQILRQGAAMNIAIARHGLSMLPPRFVEPASQDSLTRLSRLVCAGVYARMCGEPFTVMSLAGSGNKGITASVPLMLWGREVGIPDARIEEALALACLMTSATTHHLGTLSAVCGCSNAAGIGIAAALVMLEGGDMPQIGLAVSNMVGNVAGMICDGAKMGCALKTMTAVDSAFRAATLALSGIGIPASDGIVGEDGEASLINLGRLAQHGMTSVDTEILDIMQSKLKKS